MLGSVGSSAKGAAGHWLHRRFSLLVSPPVVEIVDSLKRPEFMLGSVGSSAKGVAD